MNRHKYEGAILALLALIGSSATAMAQDAAQAQPEAQPAAQPEAQPASAAASGSVGLGMSAGTTPSLGADANAQANAANNPPPAVAAPTGEQPPPLPPPPAVDAANQTDHERVVGGWGVGLLGVASLENINSTVGGNKNGVIHAPILGVRHWVSDAWGIQAGLGVAHESGTVSNNIVGESNVDDPTAWGFAAHVGVPLALFHDKHYTFLLLPEANFGFSTWRQEDNKNTFNDDGVSGRAWLLDVGARAGAEIHFGFMGMPMLALQGTVGAHLTYRDSGVKSYDADGTEVKRGHYTLGLTTANYNDPWDIFTSSISALYYFK